MLPFEIGAVVLGVLSERQTPLSGQVSPVFARVPRGFRMADPFHVLGLNNGGEASTLESKFAMIRDVLGRGFSPLRSRLEAARSRGQPFAFNRKFRIYPEHRKFKLSLRLHLNYSWHAKFMAQKRTIERLLADAEQRLRLAQRDIKKIEAELSELQRSLREAELAEQQLPLPLKPRARGLSDKWATVLNFIVLRAPNPITVDEIAHFASENNLDISRAAIRAQLHQYEKRGFVERVSDGIYLATAAARAYCDY